MYIMNKDAEGFVNQKVCLFRERETGTEKHILLFVPHITDYFCLGKL